MKPLILLFSLMSLASVRAPLNLSADLETDPVQSWGDSADDTTFWINTQDVSQSLIVGTDKKWGLNVYDLTGKRISGLAAGDINNIDSRAGFSFGPEKIHIMAGSARNTNSIDFYSMDPATRTLNTIGSLKLSYQPYGICVGYTKSDSDLHVFVTTNFKMVDHWTVQATGSTTRNRKLAFTQKNQWKVSSVTEGCVVDDTNENLYVSEERVGLWKFSLQNISEKPVLIDQVGSKGHLVADVEGVAIYESPTRKSYLVVSSQGDNSFHVYELATGKHRGSFTLVDSAKIDGVNDTDGIDVSSLVFNSQFPEGLMIAQDGSNKDASGRSQYQNFKVIDWRKIRTSLQLE